MHGGDGTIYIHTYMKERVKKLIYVKEKNESSLDLENDNRGEIGHAKLTFNS